MRAAPRSRGVLAPLLSRLLLDRGEDAGPPEALDEEELRASVRLEVARVLSTRCTLTLAQAESLAPEERSALDYGLPDLGSLSLESPADARRLERLVTLAVKAFEPRLRLLQVTVQPPPEVPGAPRVVLTGHLVQAPQAEPFFLPLRLDRDGSLLEVSHGR
ncbi:type VI secretion system baseplate subunit TssE [Archangium lansingense]|uniref:type VI secretion system baseplate subunit TssE n=1 Tax=Archangium lansingense TaxID=2995310 RepID=UPI003B7950EB